jgi:hypothetical protein
MRTLSRNREVFSNSRTDAPCSAAAMAAKKPAAPPPTMMICLELTCEELQNFRRA